MRYTNKFLVTTSILCLVSVMSMAKETSVFSVKNAGTNGISLQLTNVIETQIQVSIKDLNGVTLYDDTLSKHKINHRKYDLRNLPIGSYSVIVTYDKMMKIQKIKKQHNSIKIEKDTVQTIFKPTFNEHSDYLDLNILSLSKQNIYLKIEDDEGRIIYTNQNQINGSYQKRFNLSQLPEGSYIFTVEFIKDNINKEFTKSINWVPSIAAL